MSASKFNVEPTRRRRFVRGVGSVEPDAEERSELDSKRSNSFPRFLRVVRGVGSVEPDADERSELDSKRSNTFPRFSFLAAELGMINNNKIGVR